MELIRKDVTQILSQIKRISRDMTEGRVSLTHILQNKALKQLTLQSLFLFYLCVFFTVKLFIDGK